MAAAGRTIDYIRRDDKSKTVSLSNNDSFQTLEWTTYDGRATPRLRVMMRP
jgi:hypothetical protein